LFYTLNNEVDFLGNILSKFEQNIQSSSETFLRVRILHTIRLSTRSSYPGYYKRYCGWKLFILCIGHCLLPSCAGLLCTIS